MGELGVGGADVYGGTASSSWAMYSGMYLVYMWLKITCCGHSRPLLVFLAPHDQRFLHGTANTLKLHKVPHLQKGTYDAMHTQQHQGCQNITQTASKYCTCHNTRPSQSITYILWDATQSTAPPSKKATKYIQILHMSCRLAKYCNCQEKHIEKAKDPLAA